MRSSRSGHAPCQTGPRENSHKPEEGIGGSQGQGVWANATWRSYALQPVHAQPLGFGFQMIGQTHRSVKTAAKLGKFGATHNSRRLLDKRFRPWYV